MTNQEKKIDSLLKGKRQQTRRSPIFVRELPNSDTPSSEQGGATTTDQINGLFRLG